MYLGGKMVQREYERWQTFERLDEHLRVQLTDLQHDATALEDAFYEKITFGTGGIRGKLGPGTNRMNVYTVRKTAKGLVNYIKEHTVNYESRGVVVAYDPRHMS